MKIKFWIVYLLCFILTFIMYGEGNIMKDLFVSGCSSIIFAGILYGIYYVIAKENAKIKEMSFEQQQEYLSDLKRYQHHTAIVKTEILNQDDPYQVKGSAFSSSSRAIVGNFIAGPLGGDAGALSGKQKFVKNKQQKIEFLITYEDGHQTKEWVKVNSMRYKKLIQYL